MQICGLLHKRATVVTNCTKKREKNHIAMYLVTLYGIVPSTTNAPFKTVERHWSEYDMVFKLHLFENRYKKYFALV